MAKTAQFTEILQKWAYKKQNLFIDQKIWLQSSLGFRKILMFNIIFEAEQTVFSKFRSNMY